MHTNILTGIEHGPGENPGVSPNDIPVAGIGKQVKLRFPSRFMVRMAGNIIANFVGI